MTGVRTLATLAALAALHAGSCAAATPAMNSVVPQPVRALAALGPVVAPAPAPEPVAPAGLAAAPAGTNLKLWIVDPLTGQPVAGAPGIFIRSATSDWVQHGANADGSLYLTLAPGAYNFDTVEPQGVGSALRRHNYQIEVAAPDVHARAPGSPAKASGDPAKASAPLSGGVTMTGKTADARGYFAVTLDAPPALSAAALARLNALAAQANVPASAFVPTSACQLRDQVTAARGLGVDVAAGFPRVRTRLPAYGHVRALIVPVDFPDVPGTDAPLAFFTPLAEAVRDFYLKQSYGRLAFDFTVVQGWSRMPFLATTYQLGGRVGAGDANGYRDALVGLLDPLVDFSDYDAVYFLLPKQTPFDAIAYGPAITFPIPTRNGVIINGASGGADMYLPRNGPGAAWQWMAHETGHAFGLIDEDLDHASATLGNWSLMANNWSKGAIEHNGWDRYLMGWLGETQTACLPRAALKAGGTSVTLDPLVRQSGALKLAMVPLSTSTILVIESRKNEGYDRLAPAHEGVLVYTVDTRLGTLGGGYRTVRRPGSADPLFQDAALHAGDSVVVDGVTVTVTAQGADGDTVTLGLQ